LTGERIEVRVINGSPLILTFSREGDCVAISENIHGRVAQTIAERKLGAEIL